MVKKLYLHIGWRKTGSSAIQQLITRNTVDATFLGIRVPTIGSSAQKLVTGAAPIAHHGLANYKKPEDWAANWESFTEQVNSGGSAEYLISSEIFSSAMGKDDGYIRLLGEKLKIFDEVVIFCWLRRQDQYMNSLRVQKAKHGGVKNERKDHVKRFPADGKYFELLTKLEANITNAKIVPFAYSKNSNIESDFLHVLGREGSSLAADESSRINASVSADMFRLQLMVNEHFQVLGMDIKEMEKLFVRAWDSVPESFKREAAVPMTISERKIVVKHFQPSNEALCEKYGLDRNVFVPDEAVIEAEREYNIPDRPAPALIDEMVARLSALETGKARPKNALIEFLSQSK
jgi:hypothetical protein